MDGLSSIFTWLSDHEAGISAVVGIAVLAGTVFAGVRSLGFDRMALIGRKTALEFPIRSRRRAVAEERMVV